MSARARLRSKLPVVAGDVDFLAKPQGKAGSDDAGEVADRPAMGRSRDATKKVGAGAR